MQTLLKWFVSGVLALVALGVTVAVLFFANEKWQAQTADAFLEEATGWQWDFASLSLGWNRVEATGVFAMQHAQGFEIGKADLRVRTRSLWDWDPVIVTGGHLRECFLDISDLPASTLGFSRDELSKIPAFDEAHGAVERMVGLSLERLQAEGLSLLMRDLRLEGNLLLPQGRSLSFDVTIEEGSTMEPYDARLKIVVARFR